MDKISLIDTHAHYNSSTMTNLNELLKIAIDNEDVKKIINIGLDYKTSEEAILIGLNNSKFYSSLGIHPLYDGNVSELEELYHKYNNEKIVGIGEAGIDTNGNVDTQINKFINSIKLANKLKLPLIIHACTTRNSSINANRLCIEILKKYRPIYGFVFHFFQPDLEVLDDIIKLGGYVSVGSNILKATAKKSLEVVRTVPIDRLFIETDYSFLTNSPNETGRASFNKICELKNKEKTLMMKQLNQNAENLFYKLKNE